VKTAYQNLVKQYHPDRMEGMGKELRELAEKRTKEINQAYVEFKQRW
jgi:DnaJ-class molecular chaperone with C-terminal Zn finger domain